jgi:starvation-inducible outer membrane lipoprotein
MRSRYLLLLALLACTALSAQTVPAAAPLVQEPQPAEGRKNQRVERIHVEDTAVVIDEVRYGGQTQSITVQPKANVPEYEIQPTDLGRSRPADHRDGMSNATGQRVWNVFKF